MIRVPTDRKHCSPTDWLSALILATDSLNSSTYPPPRPLPIGSPLSACVREGISSFLLCMPIKTSAWALNLARVWGGSSKDGGRFIKHSYITHLRNRCSVKYYTRFPLISLWSDAFLSFLIRRSPLHPQTRDGATPPTQQAVLRAIVGK